MATSNRAAILIKTHKILKSHFEPAKPDLDRSLLEQLLFACCLENAPCDKASEAFAAVKQSFFDWNEVRVTTVAELAEVLAGLPVPTAAAANLKRTLQGVFEAQYSYDLETLKKLTIGKAVKQLREFGGIPEFAIDYATQNGLGGHAIPLDKGALSVLVVLDVITAAQAKERTVPGLARAIPKSKGVEFGSLLHELGAAFFAQPFAAQVRAILLEIDPGAKSRFPKRKPKKMPRKSPKPVNVEHPAGSTGKKKTSKAKKTKPAEKKRTADKTSRKKTAAKKKASAARPATTKPR